MGLMKLRVFRKGGFFTEIDKLPATTVMACNSIDRITILDFCKAGG